MVRGLMTEHKPMPGAIDPNEDAQTTNEVGSEGGGEGDVEIGRPATPGTGSEADETWRPTSDRQREIRRDETGEGRRA